MDSQCASAGAANEINSRRVLVVFMVTGFYLFDPVPILVTQSFGWHALSGIAPFIAPG
jgi:hypothetical protein